MSMVVVIVGRSRHAQSHLFRPIFPVQRLLLRRYAETDRLHRPMLIVPRA